MQEETGNNPEVRISEGKKSEEGDKDGKKDTDEPLGSFFGDPENPWRHAHKKVQAMFIKGENGQV